jgi:hypothetical protein
MAVNAGSSPCIVHFEGKLGPEKQLTNETLETIVNRRITKLERARKIAASEPPKRCSTSTDERGDPAEKVQRTTGQSFGLNYGNEATPRSSNVLPKCCLICKESGPVYVTNTVRIS